MTEDAGDFGPRDRRLGILLAMAMFVLVVDTSLMNVSISAVVRDLDTTVSGVQGAIALEALVSAAFILIGSRVGDFIGRRRAYVIGLIGYGIGATAMTLAQSLTAILIFWAVIGGLGASLLLPAMQSLIHGNFSGTAQKKVYALVGAAAAVAAAVGPLVGGFITTFASWRVGFALEAVIIVVVLVGIRLVRDAPYTGPRVLDLGGAALSVLGMGGVVLGILVWQEGGEYVAALLAVGLAALAALAVYLVRRHRAGKPTLIDPQLFAAKPFRLGVSGQMMQQITLGGLMIALPIYLQMVFEYNAMLAGLSMAPLSLSMFAIALVAGKRAGRRRPSVIIATGFALAVAGTVALLPVIPRADSGWYLVVPLILAGSGLGLLVSQLNNYTLSPMSEEKVSEAAGVNSAAGSFGLSFGLAFAGAIMLATISLLATVLAQDSTVLSPAEQGRVAAAVEEDAEVMSDTQLQEILANEPAAVQDEVLRINAEARDRALQVALLVPILASAVGLVNALRMRRLPDPGPASVEGLALG
ncbi:MAG TPA: MFS transporter [Microlunatus sp.]|nr:MFS transporter [Microlunatus sp.]HEX5578112.1 MFS transporter [Candidatus Limnocylindria bacterium]